jgi:hypothetical protein
MRVVFLPLILLLQLSSPAAGAPARAGGLRAAAQASVRPRECAPLRTRGPSGAATNVWDAARDPELARYCDFLARGFAELAFAP